MQGYALNHKLKIFELKLQSNEINHILLPLLFRLYLPAKKQLCPVNLTCLQFQHQTRLVFSLTSWDNGILLIFYVRYDFFFFLFLVCFLSKKCPKFQKPKLLFFSLWWWAENGQSEDKRLYLSSVHINTGDVISLSRYLSQEDSNLQV